MVRETCELSREAKEPYEKRARRGGNSESGLEVGRDEETAKETL